MWANTGQEEDLICYSRTLIIRTSIIRISRLSGVFLWSQFGYDYLLVTIKIRSHILFKITALKDAVKCKGFLLSKSKGSARASRKEGDIGIFGFAVFGKFLVRFFGFCAKRLRFLCQKTFSALVFVSVYGFFVF